MLNYPEIVTCIVNLEIFHILDINAIKDLCMTLVVSITISVLLTVVCISQGVYSD
jgi:hypothetical protein